MFALSFDLRCDIINQEVKMNFNSLHTIRRKFVEENKNNDHVVGLGKNNILISAPHGVSQVRLGKHKFSEIGSLATLLYLKNHTKCFTISKTKNNNDDANFDEISPYKSSIQKLIDKYNIKYVIDIHGLAKNRQCDVNLGTHLGENIKNNLEIFEKLYQNLTDNDFTVCIDQPFMGGANTIAGSVVKNNSKLWSLQIEINCSITNQKENFAKYKLLLEILSGWLNSINN